MTPQSACQLHYPVNENSNTFVIAGTKLVNTIMRVVRIQGTTIYTQTITVEQAKINSSWTSHKTPNQNVSYNIHITHFLANVTAIFKLISYNVTQIMAFRHILQHITTHSNTWKCIINNLRPIPGVKFHAHCFLGITNQIEQLTTVL